MSSLWTAWLLVHTTLTAFAQKPVQTDSWMLDMAIDAVDDMYSGCTDRMDTKVRKQYLPTEKNKMTTNFTFAWRAAEKHYNKLWRRKIGKKPSTSLSKEQIMSIYAYTMDTPNVYIDFNNAVRTQGPKYKTSFQYHSLHYFLTGAIQKLNARRSKAERCVRVHRRVNAYFRRDVVNRPVRFGSFTSSSMGWFPSAARFGDRSCFEINTCFGADVSLFSKLGEAEREVLVPPYEVFKVTAVEKRSEKKNLPCEFVYKLSSVGVVSNLNCAL